MYDRRPLRQIGDGILLEELERLATADHPKPPPTTTGRQVLDRTKGREQSRPFHFDRTSIPGGTTTKQQPQTAGGRCPRWK